MTKKGRFCSRRANILVGKAENKSKQVNTYRITANVMKTPRLRLRIFGGSMKTTSHGVGEDMPFEHVTLSRELKCEKGPSTERGGVKHSE